MKKCEDCEYYINKMSGICGFKKNTDHTGRELHIFCSDERWIHFMFWEHCGFSGRYFKKRNDS